MMVELAETDRIEADLARTRARMDSRLDELQDHLTPKQMMNDAFAYFRGGDGADFTQDLVSRAKANPLPVALAGIGIAWLMASSGKPSSTRRGIDPDALTAARDGIARGTHDIRQNASDALGTLRDGASSLQKGTRTMSSSTRDTLGSLAANPFALGAVAAVVGIVAGSLLPTFEHEEDVLGATATKLRTAGRDLAQDVVDRGGRIAGETLDAVKESAGSHGLTADKPVGEVLSEIKSGDLAGRVKAVANETVQAGHESTQKHLSSESGSGDRSSGDS